MSTQTARSRAEELLNGLTRRARELVDAEEGLAHTVREAIEDRNLSPVEVRRQLEQLVGRLKTADVWDRLRGAGDLDSALRDGRGEVERRVDGLWANLPVASRADVERLERRLLELEERIVDLEDID